MTVPAAETETPKLEWTDEQNRHAFKLFGEFDFGHAAFRDRDYGRGSQMRFVGQNLRGCRTGLNRLMDTIDGRELEIGTTTRGEVFDCLAQMYVARQLQDRNTPENVLREIRDELAFVDFAVWRRLEQEVADQSREYPDGFLDGLEPPRDLPRVPGFLDTSFP